MLLNNDQRPLTRPSPSSSPNPILTRLVLPSQSRTGHRAPAPPKARTDLATPLGRGQGAAGALPGVLPLRGGEGLLPGGSI
jgi:hypothetical protein